MKSITCDNTEFDIWAEMFHYKCRELGHKGPIDPDSVTNDYNDGMDVNEAAKSFVEEMQS